MSLFYYRRQDLSGDTGPLALCRNVVTRRLGGQMPRTEMSPDLVQKSAQALVVGAEMDRWGRPIRTSAYEVWTKVSQTDTSQQWSLFEGRVPSGLAVPLHLHHGQEEWFWVLGGSFVFEVGGQIHRLREGMSLLIPRQIPHRWKKTNDADGRLLILAQPADRLENFFERMAGLSAEQQQDAAVWRSLYADCRMELLGPPLEDSDC